MDMAHTQHMAPSLPSCAAAALGWFPVGIAWGTSRPCTPMGVHSPLGLQYLHPPGSLMGPDPLLRSPASHLHHGGLWFPCLARAASVHSGQVSALSTTALTHTHTHSIHSVGRVAPRSPAGLLDAHSELLASQWMPSSGCPPADALQQPLSPVVQLLCSCRDDVGAPGWNGHQRPPRWTHPFLPGPWRATGEHSERQGSGFGAGTAGTSKASRAHGKQRQRQRSLLWLDPT